MGLFDKISKLFVKPVSTRGATTAVNQGANQALSRFDGNIDASDEVRNMLLQMFRDPESFEGTPAFNFALGQGIRARDRSAAARGQLGSGNHQRELTLFGQQLANQDRRNEINSLASFFGQTNPSNFAAADIDINRGKNLAGISLGKENARVAGSNSLLSGTFGLLGRGLGRF